MVLYICMSAQTVIQSNLSLCSFMYILNSTGSEHIVIYEQPVPVSISATTAESLLFHSQEELDQAVLAVQPHALGVEGYVSGGRFPG